MKFGEACFKASSKTAFLSSWLEGNKEDVVKVYKLASNSSSKLVQATWTTVSSSQFIWIFFQDDGDTIRARAVLEKADKTFNAFEPPSPKYPTGTYQSVWHERVAELETLESFGRASEQDKAKLDFGDDGKLKSLKGLQIPIEADPMTYLNLVGKIDVLLFIDYTNDMFYIKPNGYAEAFVALYVPERKVEEIESAEDYAVFRIVDYSLVSRSFKSNASNINAIMDWIKCKKEDIKHDEYELFYWIDAYDAYPWMLEKLRSTVSEHFVKVEFYDIRAKAYDDVSIRIEDFSKSLDYQIEQCRWKLAKSSSASFAQVGKIEWSEPSGWKNVDPETANIIEAETTGYGIVEVSRRHLELVTGSVSLEEGGELTDEQFKSFRVLNGPEVSPFQRLQYFLEIEVGHR